MAPGLFRWSFGLGVSALGASSAQPVSRQKPAQCQDDPPDDDDQHNQQRDCERERQVGMMPDRHANPRDRAELGDVGHRVGERLRRGIDRIAESELGAVGRRCQTTADQYGGNGHPRVEVVHSRRRQYGRRNRSNSRLDRLPNARHAWYESDDELGRVNRDRHADDPPITDDIEAGRQMSDPSLALRKAEHGYGRGHVDPCRVGDT